MPFLRFSRDRRGYETTALVHSYRRQGRSQQRVLYWFRSPVDVRVGRAAFDEDAIRLIEEHHPDVSFDWPKILDVNAIPAADEAAQKRPDTPRAAEARRRDRPGRRTRQQEPQPALAAPASAEHEDLTAADEADTAAAPAVEAGEAEAPSHRGSAAEASFSIEDLARLRGRHSALLARIDSEVADAEKSEALRRQADRLNPDTWVTAEDVREALENYESVYREIRQGLGRRRRKRRRGGGASRAEEPASQSATGAEGDAPGEADTPGTDDPDEE